MTKTLVFAYYSTRSTNSMDNIMYASASQYSHIIHAEYIASTLGMLVSDD